MQRQMNLSTKQKQTHRLREQTGGSQGERGGRGVDWEFGLGDASCYIQNGETTGSCCTAQGTRSTLLG